MARAGRARPKKTIGEKPKRGGQTKNQAQLTWNREDLRLWQVVKDKMGGSITVAKLTKLTKDIPELTKLLEKGRSPKSLESRAKRPIILKLSDDFVEKRVVRVLTQPEKEKKEEEKLEELRKKLEALKIKRDELLIKKGIDASDIGRYKVLLQPLLYEAEFSFDFKKKVKGSQSWERSFEPSFIKMFDNKCPDGLFAAADLSKYENKFSDEASKAFEDWHDFGLQKIFPDSLSEDWKSICEKRDKELEEYHLTDPAFHS